MSSQRTGARPMQDVQLLKERLYEALSKTEKNVMTSTGGTDCSSSIWLATSIQDRMTINGIFLLPCFTFLLLMISLFISHPFIRCRLRVSGTLNSFIHTTGLAGILLFSCTYACFCLQNAWGRRDEGCPHCGEARATKT